MSDESKAIESLGKTLERLEKVLERVEKQLDKLEIPVRERGREEKEEERVERMTDEEAERADEEAEREAERADEEAEREAERAEEYFPFGAGKDFEKRMEQVGESIGRKMEHMGREMERHFERRFGSERPTKTEEYKLNDFSSIKIGGIFDIQIERADSYSVNVTADEDLFKNLNVEKKGEKLEVSHARHISWWSKLSRPKVEITLPILKGLELSGASRATFKGFSSTEDFKLDISGASKVTGDITTGDAKFDVSGASRAELNGSGKDIVIDASGASHLDLNRFSAHNVAVRLGGAARCAIKLDGRLDARLAGASQLGYIGNALMGDIRTSSASRLFRR